MDFGYADRVAIVTGGASNIGRAITLALAAEGARVAVFDVDPEQAAKVEAEEAGRVSSFEVDVSSPESVAVAVAEAAGQIGAAAILVNNVGWVRPALFLEKDPAEGARELELNLVATIDVTRAVMPSMVEQGWGRVVNIASDAGKVGEYSETIYSAAKAGVLGFTRSLAKEVGKAGVTVNAVCPALTVPESRDHVGEMSMQRDRIRSPEFVEKVAKRYPVGRLGRPGDIASTVAFLASEQAAFITGQTISVNGGFLTC